MESSYIDNRPSIRISPSNIEDAAAGTYSKHPKVTRCKMDEVPLGADSGAAFAHAATMSSYAGIDEMHTAAKVPQSSGASRRVKAKTKAKCGIALKKPDSESDDSAKGKRKVQPQPADSPIHISSRFSGELRSTDGKDLKLFGLMPETYEVDMLESDIKCELMEFGLVGGPQPYPCDSFSKIPCW